MAKQLINLWQVLKDTGKKFIKDKPMNYSASIAFYTIFSLPAILLITVAIAQSVYNDAMVRETLLDQLGSLLGQESAAAADKILANANAVGHSVWTRIIGIATLVFSATTVFISMQGSLNSIWGIKPKPERNVVKFIINRLLSLAMVISIGFLLLVSLIIDTLIALLQNIISEWLSDAAYYVVSGVNIMISLGIITFIFALLFKILPDAKIRWKEVWIGSFVTTLLFTLGKFLIGIYLSNTTVGNAYGAAGSLVLILIWVYYSSLIILFGAEFTFVYSRQLGKRIQPNEHSVLVQEVERETDSGKVGSE